MQNTSHTRARWSGQLAFVLAAAASAIGLGNLWRFPYLAARYGGGVFIAVYLTLALSFGFVLLVTEIALGRRARQSQLTVFSALGHPRWNVVGYGATLVPIIICSYYAVIGGWVVKYFTLYVQAAFSLAHPFADPQTAFDSFISAPFAPYGYTLVFALSSAAVLFLGVKRGIEKSNLVMMPLLFLLALALAVYVATLPGAGAGIRFYLVPDFALCDNFGKVVLGALGQMFFSISAAMGIMITYGSYMRREDSIPAAAVRVALADTAVAVLAGFMVIPAVFAFAGGADASSGRLAVEAGPSLMFVCLPKVFASLGGAGAWMGLAFFLLVLFAALTSSISIMEACVAAVGDFFKLRRAPSILVVLATTLALGSLSAFGYGRWSRLWKPFGLPWLDFFDLATNAVLMPLVAAGTCLFAGWILSPKRILEECEWGGRRFPVPRFYALAVKWFAPLVVGLILVSELCRNLKIGGWSI